MKFSFTREMHADLHEVDELFQNSLVPWWDEVGFYMNEIEEDPTFSIIPAIVIMAYQNLGLGHNISIQMANIFKTVYFANRIHVTVKDSEEGQEYDQRLQFTILIGDYIFGRILKLLLEAEASNLLDDFSKMMCEMNEGFLLEHKLSDNVEICLQKARAPLYSTAFLTAAKLSNLDSNKIRLYEEIGYHLGLALELLFRGENTLSTGYRYETEVLIEEFAANLNETGFVLGPFVKDLFNGSLIIPAAVG